MKIQRLLVRSALSVLVVAAFCVAVAPSPKAAAVASFQPVRAIFNNPNGTEEQRYAIVSYIDRAIDAAPKGSVIHIALYSIYTQSTTDKLLAARKRGVIIKMVTDDHYSSPQVAELVKAFGTKVSTGSGSFVKVCHRSCSSDMGFSYMHAKLFMFSAAGSYKNLVMIGSSNLSEAQINLGWNNMYTLVNRSKIYDSLTKYFTALTRDANDKDTAYRETVDGNVKTYAFPRWEGKRIDRNSDTYYGILGHITCSGAASGYGKDGKTVVSVASYQWSWYRLYLAQRLWNLDNAGCDVRVVYSAQNTDAKVMAALKKTGGKYGGIKMHNADQDGPELDDKYSHNKYVLVSGVYGGNRSSKLVFTGSANFTQTALRYNNEVIVKLRANAAYDLYRDNFLTIYSFKSTTTVAPPKSTTIAPPNSVEGRPEVD